MTQLARQPRGSDGNEQTDTLDEAVRIVSTGMPMAGRSNYPEDQEMRTVAMAVGLLVAAALAQSQSADARFGKPVRPLEHVQITAVWSPDGKTCSIILENLSVEVGQLGAEDADTKVFSFVAPIEETEGSRSVSLDLRGHVVFSSGSRAALLIQAGGETRTLQWSDGAESGDFTETVEAGLPAGSDYQVTLFLLVERDTHRPEATATLTVDTLDLTLGG